MNCPASYSEALGLTNSERMAVCRWSIILSTRLIKVAANARPTLRRTDLIYTMDDDRAWFWWLAGTDRLNQTALFQPWTGPHGERGFTHAPPAGFSFATSALGDPQFKSEGNAALLVDLWAEALPALLDVSVATKFFQPGQANYKAQPNLGEAKDGWVTLRLPAGDFHDANGAPLASWKDVDFLCLSGASTGLKRAVFKNVRWEKLTPQNP